MHIVDIPGTFAEQVGGPFAGGKVTQRPDYRMLAAIIVGKDAEVYIKLTGPAKTVEAHRGRLQEDGRRAEEEESRRTVSDRARRS